MEHTDEKNKIDLISYLSSTLRALKKIRLYAILAVILCAVVFTLYSHFTYSPVYEVSTAFTVKIVNPLYSETSVYNAQTAEQMEKTFPYVLSSNALKTAVKDRLGVGSLPSITASVTKGTNVFTLKVSGNDPEYIYNVLTAVIDCYPEVADYVFGPTKMILITEPFIPTYPINSVNYVKSAVIGVLAGAVLSLAVAFVLAFMSDTVSDEASLGRLVNVTRLGAIPAIKTVGKEKRPLLTDASGKHGFADAVNMTRIRLEKELDSQRKKVVLISSALPSEGKTTVSVNLAIAMARRGKRTLIIDCDLRNPSVAEAFGIENGTGVAEYLEKKAPMQSVIKPSGVKNLYVVTAGNASGEDTVEHLSDRGFRVLIDSCKGVFDMVILDTPPCGVLADASDLANVAECAVLVVRRDYASKTQILEGASMLSENRINVIGTIFNGSQGGDTYGYYGYGKYGYGYGKYGYGKYGGRSGETDEAEQ